MELIRPSAEYRDSYLAAFAEPEPMPRQMGFDLEMARTDFPRFVRELNERAEGKHMPEGYVPDSVYWLVDDGEYIGRISIRHHLSDHLKEIGGHIGYDIRPSKRNQGYGSRILALALPKARELGITDVLVTCDATNDASRKIIEKNGGVLENQVPSPAGGPDKLRFWIPLMPVFVFREVDRERFEEVRCGEKQIETRAAAPKYRSIKPGDTVTLQCGDDSFTKIVTKTYHWQTIEAMLAEVPLARVMPDVETIEQARERYASYPGYAEKLKEYGIAGFELG